MWRCLVLAGTFACGRLGFAPVSDAPDVPDVPDVPDAVPTDGARDPSLVLHLPFEGADPLRDHSSFGHDGTCTACPTYEPGPYGTAASFAGAGCVVVPDAAPLRSEVFTVAVFARPRVIGLMSFVSRPYQGATTNDNTIQLYQNINGTWVGVSEPVRTVQSAVPADVWHHLAMVYDGAQVALYFDGALADTTVGSALAHTADDLRIGCDVNSGNVTAFTDGWIDEVRLYDRALSAAEIAVLATAP